MKHPIVELLDFLQFENIRYYLLRPVSLKEHNADIDVIIPDEDLQRLLQLLKNTHKEISINNRIANHTLQIQIGSVILDVKTRVCFLPTKSLAFNDCPPYSGYQIEQGHWVFPTSSKASLFTFWTLHLFLDKKRVQDSSTFAKYLDWCEKEGNNLVRHPYLEFWAQRLFSTKKNQFLDMVEEVLSGNVNRLPDNYQQQVKQWWTANFPRVHLMYYPQKWKYGFYRRMGFSTFRALAQTENSRR